MIAGGESPDAIDDMVRRIEVAIRKLPLLPEKDTFVFGAAVLVAASAEGGLYDLEHRPGGDKKAIRQLVELAERLKSARHALEGLSQEAFRALCEEPPGTEVNLDIAVTPIRAILLGLQEQALLAKSRLEAKPIKRAVGAPRDDRAAEVADRALGCYEALTGKRAHVTVDPYQDKSRRTGEFLNFLTDIFSVLGLSASPGYQAQRAVKDRTMGDVGFMWLLQILVNPEGVLKPKR